MPLPCPPRCPSPPPRPTGAHVATAWRGHLPPDAADPHASCSALLTAISPSSPSSGSSPSWASRAGSAGRPRPTLPAQACAAGHHRWPAGRPGTAGGGQAEETGGGRARCRRPAELSAAPWHQQYLEPACRVVRPMAFARCGEKTRSTTAPPPLVAILEGVQAVDETWKRAENGWYAGPHLPRPARSLRSSGWLAPGSGPSGNSIAANRE
jgi:hypothetical protein